MSGLSDNQTLWVTGTGEPSEIPAHLLEGVTDSFEKLRARYACSTDNLRKQEGVIGKKVTIWFVHHPARGYKHAQYYPGMFPSHDGRKAYVPNPGIVQGFVHGAVLLLEKDGQVHRVPVGDEWVEIHE